MQRKKAWFYLLLVVVLGCSFIPNSLNEVHAKRVKTFTATVKKVVDGDTIHLEEDIFGAHKVRLLNIDTPESVFFGHKQEPWGKDATNFLLELIPPGTKITVITDSVVKDQYGRLLAHLKKGDLDINKELLRQGYATMYYIYPNMLYFRDYQRALLKAMKEQKGIWNPDNLLPEEPFEFRSRIRSGEAGTKKFVGDFYKKTYVAPANYTKIPTQNRVFFLTEIEAIKAGYTKEVEQDYVLVS